MPTFQRRILHVLDSLERGGIAAWLMTVLRNIPRDGFQMDFLVHTDKACAYDDEARALGATIINCPGHRNFLSYASRFSRIMRECGPYDVVHGHCQRFTGLNLLLASRAGVPTRIAHSHNDLRSLASSWRPARRFYHCLMDRLIDRYATVGLAASRMAAEDLFGDDWQSDPRWRILFCGIDFTPFREEHDRSALGVELGLPDDSKVIVHVGRFTHQKNVPFILEVFSHALKKDPRLRLIFVGDGPLEDITKEQVVRQKLANEVTFLGSRPDVPRLLLGVADLFLFPSLYEGLGLAFVEAQAAGVPCLVSATIPEEADVVPTLVRRLSLSLPSSVWAEEALQLLERERPVSRQQALALAERSPINVADSLKQLEAVYCGS
ncbi:MAG: glycosyltransferase [Desulfomonile tiedjei]|uniref:Glycosyltransferase n=1 Tax=Desulfomonile tiedjei TaxID=2358 RepID=A0A9D6V3P1_9BACT|nr:glycosyltransferase [Desulfomonile tiedjei]